jgi:hypothetical protein
MPSKDLRAGLKGRSGYRTIRLRGSRGRTFNATLTTRTNATTGTFKIRSGAFKPVVSGATKNVTQGHKAADTFVDRY